MKQCKNKIIALLRAFLPRAERSNQCYKIIRVPGPARFLRGGGGVRKLSLLFALPLLCLALALAGCEHNAEDSGVLTGTWKNVYDPGGDNEFTTEIRITPTAINYVDSYEGTIKNSPDFKAPYGVIIIQFTKYATNYDGNPVATHPNVGKFGAIYWKDLTSDSVYLSDAGIASDEAPYYTHTMFPNLEGARAAFTNENVNTYVNWSIISPYTK
jgi:hypothetical protein